MKSKVSKMLKALSMYQKLIGKRIPQKLSLPAVDDSNIFSDMYIQTLIVFVGSSIIRRWSFDHSNFKYLNRGVDSLRVENLKSESNIEELKNINAKIVCFYCGSNDFLNQRNTEDILSDSIYVLDNIKCPILYISVIKNPLLHRIMKDFSTLDEFNNNIQEYLNTRRDSSKFMSTDDLFTDDDFKWDGVHLKKTGYKKLQEKLERELIVKKLLT
tara:strand:- start:453 stop:1094 length:642 start_codon:yes stop_codon:yes gene_type:complete